ncbi:C39 family peptidase [Nocardia sp. NPDC004151]|uniref:C39 family peptidase n=1 Tax=Nocardia sp. NPDC004151 TaxID=3364304 RepID=UPI0036C05876
MLPHLERSPINGICDTPFIHNARSATRATESFRDHANSRSVRICSRNGRRTAMTRDQVAQAIIAEGQRRGISQRGIVIALATGLVESNLTIYANPAVPESMQLEHDAVGTDGFSVGVFQQQIRQGDNGEYWWADCATCMNPTTSAGLFYERLARLDYNGPDSPGSYAQEVQRSAFPDRYDERMSDAQDIYDRLASVSQSGEPTEKELPYDRSIVPQERFFWCGPAATQIVCNSCGVNLSEQYLATEIGTTENGTDYVGLITPVLNRILPAAKYVDTYMHDDPPTGAQKDRLWKDIVNSIDAGFGVVANIDAPPNNYPQGVKGSVSPVYGGGEVFHYIALMGYDSAFPRAVWVADSGFSPYGYWIGFDQLATLIPPKGYTSATAAPMPTLPIGDVWIQLFGDGGDNMPGTGWPQLGGRTLVDEFAAIGQKLKITRFAAPTTAVNVPFPAGVDAQIRDVWIQFFGDGDDFTPGTGWPQLGGHTLVDGVAAIGQKLKITGFGAPTGATNVPFPTGAAGQIPDVWIQLMGVGGNGWPQLGGHTLVDGVAAIGQKLTIDGFAPPPGATQVSFPARIADQVRDLEIQLMGITGNGWPQLGGHTLVDGVAEIGKATKAS